MSAETLTPWQFAAVAPPNLVRRAHESSATAMAMPELYAARFVSEGLRVGLLILVLEATEDDQLIANKGPP
ncbi:MAG: hypothetical protein WCA59_07875 [Candidatus Binataceae bacterium]